MRIALISSLFPPYAIGGAEQMAAGLALAFQDLGHHVEVISTGRRAETDCWEGIPVRRIAPWNLYWSFDKEQSRPGRIARGAWHAVDLWNPTIIRPLRQALESIRPDVVNTHNIDGLSPLVWAVAREQTAALVHTLHDYHLLCPRATMRRADGSICEQLCRSCRIYARYQRLFQKHVRILAAPASAIAAEHRLSGWTVPELRIIPNAVDAGGGKAGTAPATGPLRVLFLSRLVREKGSQTLLDMLPIFRDAAGIEFHVAGRGEYEPRFARMAELMPNLTWHGFVEGRAKQELLASADVFLQLSECRENAPLAMIEARRHGLYIVGSQIGGIPELIDGPDSGRLIPPGDPKALAAILEEMSDRKDEIRVGRPQRIHRRAGYGVRDMAELYLQAFTSLIE
jgi:glycosyltransferase involved in cell wall biosynthesis